MDSHWAEQMVFESAELRVKTSDYSLVVTRDVSRAAMLETQKVFYLADY